MEPFLHKNTIVIGGGQAGLATGYYLKQNHIDFCILDDRSRTGDSWRSRWDTLRVFTPNRYNHLPGLKFPGRADAYPTKDEIADYLEMYAQHHQLPVLHNTRVLQLSRSNGQFVIDCGEKQIAAQNVIVAMSGYQNAYAPKFRNSLHPDIYQIHSKDYRNANQLKPGNVLVVGASDSGCEIAMEAAKNHTTYLSGRHPGHVPFDIDSTFGRQVGVRIVIGFLFHHLLARSTPIGRKAREKLLDATGPNVRHQPRHLKKAGVRSVPRITEVVNGLPRPQETAPLDVQNVIWCTGYRPSLDWIDIPSVRQRLHPKDPPHQSGIMPDDDGLYFVGLFFTHAVSSSLLRGVARDAERVVKHLVNRKQGTP